MYFPTDKITGLPRRRFFAERPDYDRITDSWEYEDGSPDFNEVAPAENAKREWEYGFTLVSATNTDPASAQQFDDFYDTVRKVNPFYFTDKYGVTRFPVYVKSYSHTHELHKPWVAFIDFKLIGYKAQVVSVTNPTVELTEINIAGTNVEISGTVSALCDLRLIVNGSYYSITNDNGSFVVTAALVDLLAGINSFYVVAVNPMGGYAISNTLTFNAIPDPYPPGETIIFSVTGASTSHALIKIIIPSDEEAYGAEDEDDYLI